MQNLTRRIGPSLRNYTFSRAGAVHHAEFTLSRALERSIAQKLRFPTRGNGPPLGKCRISRGGTVHRSEFMLSRARESSTAQEMQNLARWNSPAFFTSAFKVICEAGK